MKDTITTLWNGCIVPCERCGANDRNLRQLSELMLRHSERLRQEMTDHQKEVFQKYIDCSEEYLHRIQDLTFQEGFSLACKLLSEGLG